MKIRSFVTATLILLGTLPLVGAATAPTPPGLASPSLTAPPISSTTPAPETTSPGVRAQVDGPHVTSVSQAVSAPTSKPVSRISAPDGRPTLGDWEDLAERQAFRDQLAKLNGDSSPQAQLQPQQTALPLPPGTQQSHDSDPPRKPRRASESCGDGDAACFYAVYGIHIEGGSDNYHGLLAIDGLVQAVYKGKRFVTSHGRYTVKDISTHELSYVDARGRTHTVPFSGEADVQADPTDLKTGQQPPPAQPPTFGFQQR